MDFSKAGLLEKGHRLGTASTHFAMGYDLAAAIELG
jgi:hypothetical protein